MLVSLSKTKETNVAGRLLSLLYSSEIKELLLDNEDTATTSFFILGNLVSFKSLSEDYSRGIEKKGNAPASSSFEPLTVFVD